MDIMCSPCIKQNKGEMKYTCKTCSVQQEVKIETKGKEEKAAMQHSHVSFCCKRK